MILSNICSMFDSYDVVEKASQIYGPLYASSEHIFTDGTYHSHINKNGYIEIYEIADANYIMFLDQTDAIYIKLYKYTPETMYKEIINNLNMLRKLTGIKSKVDDDSEDDDIEPEAEESKEDIKIPDSLRSKYVDINTFVCPECTGKMRYSKINGTDAIIVRCAKCSTEYTLMPSKYYVIRAKKITYKSQTGRRNVKFE